MKAISTLSLVCSISVLSCVLQPKRHLGPCEEALKKYSYFSVDSHFTRRNTAPYCYVVADGEKKMKYRETALFECTCESQMEVCLNLIHE